MRGSRESRTIKQEDTQERRKESLEVSGEIKRGGTSKQDCEGVIRKKRTEKVF